MSAHDALLQLCESTADAVANVLEQLAPGGIDRGAVVADGAADTSLAGVVTPAVAVSVSYVDGVTGSNLFFVSTAAARRLAAAMMGQEQPEELAADELSELELSAVSEAANQMLAAAAAATGRVLEEEVEIDVPKTRLVSTIEEAADLYEKTPHHGHVSFSIFGEACRFVQFVPNAFVVKMDRALEAQAGTLLADDASPSGVALDPTRLRGVPLRVWAELGRARPPIGRTVDLGPGSVLELDRAVDDPVDLYVNGRRFAAGRLLIADDGDWAVQIETVDDGLSLGSPTTEGVA